MRRSGPRGIPPRGFSVRSATALAGVLLFATYVATLAPDVTFWDSGELVTAAHALGIPHPPGTPLFVLALNAWARLFPFLPFAVATNLFSAVCTTAAAVLTAPMLRRNFQPRGWMGEGGWEGRAGWYVLAAALCAGGMSTARLNATETEVYAASLLLAAATLACADRAGRLQSGAWRGLTAYLIVLAVPLHLSALVAAPASVYLASTSEEGLADWRSLLALSGVFLLAVGVGRVSYILTGLAIVVIAVSPLAGRLWRSMPKRTPSPPALVCLTAVAVSVLVFMLLRARHDPHINQGAPTTFAALTDVVARRQYDVPPLWPRGAPFWLQIGNLFEYADWQMALSLGPTVVPTIPRGVFTVVFALLGVVGSVAHHRADPRRWRALLVLLICGSIGVVTYLNLKASPSFGWGILPASVQREARERDYFFVLGFWVWGLWAGYGAVALATRLQQRPLYGLIVAALPVVLNWRAVTRRHEPESSLPRRFGEALLGSAPSRAVLFVDGDNDTYPLWFLQEVDSLRRDVTVVTIPLLGAEWYGRELAHRWQLAPAESGGRRYAATPEELAARARELGRPVSAAISLTPSYRNQLASGWTLRGMVYVANDSAADHGAGAPEIGVDSAATREWKAWIDRWLRGRRVRPSTDTMDEYVVGLFACPRLMLTPDPNSGQADSLASVCNRR